MEIEITGFDKISVKAIIALLVSVLLAVLGMIGRAYTPVSKAGDSQVLFWTEWEIIKAEKVYQAELNSLRGEADILTVLFNEDPDPVRTQITVDRIIRQYTSGQPALTYQRELLIETAKTVSDWSVGAASFEETKATLEDLVAALRLQANEDGNSSVTHQYGSFVPYMINEANPAPVGVPYP